jgi:hypothetical protein
MKKSILYNLYSKTHYTITTADSNFELCSLYFAAPAIPTFTIYHSPLTIPSILYNLYSKTHYTIAIGDSNFDL